jgi:hypothetical protein
MRWTQLDCVRRLELPSHGRGHWFDPSTTHHNKSGSLQGGGLTQGSMNLHKTPPM